MMIQSLYTFIIKGGPLVWPILGCSVLGVAIFFERLFYLWRIRRSESGILKTLESHFKAGDILEFFKDLPEATGPALNMIKEAAGICCDDSEALETVLDFHIDAEVEAASKYMDTLATLGAISPLLGLLGTVTGLIKAFMVIEASGGKVNASMLAGGIWEAMLTTAFGLAVALLLIVGHRFLLSRVKHLEDELEHIAILLLKGAYHNRKANGLGVSYEKTSLK